MRQSFIHNLRLMVLLLSIGLQLRCSETKFASGSFDKQNVSDRSTTASQPQTTDTVDGSNEEPASAVTSDPDSTVIKKDTSAGLLIENNNKIDANQSSSSNSNEGTSSGDPEKGGGNSSSGSSSSGSGSSPSKPIVVNVLSGSGSRFDGDGWLLLDFKTGKAYCEYDSAIGRLQPFCYLPNLTIVTADGSQPVIGSLWFGGGVGAASVIDIPNFANYDWSNIQSANPKVARVGRYDSSFPDNPPIINTPVITNKNNSTQYGFYFSDGLSSQTGSYYLTCDWQITLIPK